MLHPGVLGRLVLTQLPNPVSVYLEKDARYTPIVDDRVSFCKASASVHKVPGQPLWLKSDIESLSA